MPAIDLIEDRRGTAATWTSVNPVLNAGEHGFETDTVRCKVGDGIHPWTALPYLARDDQVVHLAGAETIPGVKTFTGGITGLPAAVNPSDALPLSQASSLFATPAALAAETTRATAAETTIANGSNVATGPLAGAPGSGAAVYVPTDVSPATLDANGNVAQAAPMLGGTFANPVLAGRAQNMPLAHAAIAAKQMVTGFQYFAQLLGAGQPVGPYKNLAAAIGGNGAAVAPTGTGAVGRMGLWQLITSGANQGQLTLLARTITDVSSAWASPAILTDPLEQLLTTAAWAGGAMTAASITVARPTGTPAASSSDPVIPTTVPSSGSITVNGATVTYTSLSASGSSGNDTFNGCSSSGVAVGAYTAGTLVAAAYCPGLITLNPTAIYYLSVLVVSTGVLNKLNGLAYISANAAQIPGYALCGTTTATVTDILPAQGPAINMLTTGTGHPAGLSFSIPLAFYAGLA